MEKKNYENEGMIRVDISSYFPNYTYENNTVEMVIPREAAEIIQKAWHSQEMPQMSKDVIHGKFLCMNQKVRVTLSIAGQTVGGMNGAGCIKNRKQAAKFVKATAKNSFESRLNSKDLIGPEDYPND